jgi:hypothetical protein
MSIAAALNELKNQRQRLEGQLRQVENAITSLNSLNGGSVARGRRKISAAGRARIVAAQKKRWAKVKAKKKWA